MQKTVCSLYFKKTSYTVCSQFDSYCTVVSFINILLSIWNTAAVYTFLRISSWLWLQLFCIHMVTEFRNSQFEVCVLYIHYLGWSCNGFVCAQIKYLTSTGLIHMHSWSLIPQIHTPHTLRIIIYFFDSYCGVWNTLALGKEELMKDDIELH